MPAAGAIIGAAGSLGGAALSSKGAEKAGDAAQQGAREANMLNWKMYGQSRNDQLPWMQTGANALGMMSALLNLPGVNTPQYALTDNYNPQGGGGTGSSHFDIFNPIGTHKSDGLWGAIKPVDSLDPLGLFRHGHNDDDDNSDTPPAFTPAEPPATQVPGSTTPPGVSPLTAQEAFKKYQDSTGYQFRLGEGLQATERSAAARGGLNSGATLKALERYGQNIGSAEFGNYLGQLGTLAGFGQSTARDVGQQGIQTGQYMGGNMMNAANARGTAYQNQANAWSQGLNQLGGVAGYYFGGNRSGAPSGGGGGWTGATGWGGLPDYGNRWGF